MGKSKSKKNQPKRYDTPTDKYLVVDNPPGGNPSEHEFFNRVAAWLEIMFKAKYPGTRPSAIFYTSTQRCLIVEIPDFIDTEPYIGAHYWSSFLSKPWHSNTVTCIYDYNFRFFPLPSQMGWKAGYSSYTSLPSEGFWVKDPYPDPPSLPAHNSLMPFACKLTGAKLLPAELPLNYIPNNDLIEEKEKSNTHIPPQSLKSSQDSSEDIKPLHSPMASITKTPLLLPLKPPVSSLAALMPTSRMPSLAPLISLKPLQRNLPIPNPTSSASSSSSRSQSQDPRGKLKPLIPQPQHDNHTTNSDTSRFQPYRAPAHLPEAERHVEFTPIPEPEPHRSSSPSSMGLPRFAPSSKLVKKLDPYEEEEVAKELLRRSQSTSVPPHSTTRFVSTTSDIKVKNELLKVDDFLNDIINPSRPSTSEQDADSYVPSNELLGAFQSLQNSQPISHDPVPKTEVMEDGLPDYMDEDKEEYQPSSELMVAFAALEQRGDVGTDVNPSVGNRCDETAFVKAEPKEDTIPTGSTHVQSRPTGMKREASFTDHDLKRVRVKLEPE